MAFSRQIAYSLGVQSLAVLHLEDNPQDRELVRQELDALQMRLEVVYAQTRREFEDALEQRSFDLIISDYSLPSYGGDEALQRALQRRPETPFIFVSGTVGEERAVETMKAGATDYVLKAHLSRLGPVVLRALRERREREERERAEDALRASQQQFASAFEDSSVGMALFTPDGRWFKVNAALANMVGYTIPEMMERSFVEITLADDLEANREGLREMIEGRRSTFQMEKRYVHKSGRIVWGLLNISAVRDQHGRVQHMISQVQDISARKEAEAKLRETDERYRAVFNRSLDAVYVHDFEGRFLDANPAALRLLGYDVSQITTLGLADVLHADELPRARGSIERLLVTGAQEGVAEYRLRRRDGGEVWVEVLSSLVFERGRPAAVQGIAREITARKRAEAALRASEERFRAIFEQEPECVKMLDDESRIIEMNPAGLRILEAESIAQVAGRPVLDFIHSDDRAAVAAMYQAVRDGQPTMLRFRTRGLRGGERWVEDHSTVVADQATGARSVLSVVRDITEQRNAEQALRASETRLLLASRAANIGLWEWDVNADQVYFSPEWKSQLGYRDDELPNRFSEWADRLHPADRESALGHAQALREGREESFETEFRLRHRDGSYRWILSRAQVFSDATDGRPRATGCHLDITERVQAEIRLREQAELLDKAQEAIVVRDLENRIRFWNRGAERLYGWHVDEVLGRRVDELGFEDALVAAAAREMVMTVGEWSGEMPQVSRHGGAVLVEARWTLVRDDTGVPRSILAINNDVTEQKKIEAQSLRNQRLESLGTLAGGISHDLNNMLAPITMGVGLLQAMETDPQKLETIRIIEASAARGRDLVKQILSFARGVEGARIAIQLAHIVREIEYVVTSTFPKNIRFTSSVPKDAWLVLGDPTQLNQVLLNLCVNARDAMPRGGRLSVMVRNTEIDAQFAVLQRGVTAGHFVAIDVADSGVGMTKDVVARVFEPFFTTKPHGAGTGLGLSTALGIVQSHHGFIDVQSEPGRGTVFTVYLPASGDRATLASAAPEVPPLPRGHGELVMLVDDETTVRSITQETLETFGYRVLAAEDGAQAIALFAQQPDDVAVVLTDMMMPIMDGGALIAALRRLRPALPIIAASGVPAADAGLRPLSGDGVHFLSKPYTAEKLLTLLRQALTSRS